MKCTNCQEPARARGLCWKHYQQFRRSSAFTPVPYRKLTPAEVQEIYRRAMDGEKQQAVAEDYGISRVTVSQILNRD